MDVAQEEQGNGGKQSRTGCIVFGDVTGKGKIRGTQREKEEG